MLISLDWASWFLIEDSWEERQEEFPEVKFTFQVSIYQTHWRSQEAFCSASPFMHDFIFHSSLLRKHVCNRKHFWAILILLIGAAFLLVGIILLVPHQIEQ